MTKKRVLTTGNDRFGGTSGKDLYVGAILISGSDTFATLNSDDRLDGGKGIDTVRAGLVTGLVVPTMKNIEIGIFTLAKDVPMTLDLARAGQMTALDLRAGNGIGFGSVTPTLYVQHAAGVNEISMTGVASQTFNVEGIDTRQVRTQHVTFSNVEFGKLDLETKTGASFAVLDITLDHANFGRLIGDVASPNIRIHSAGKDSFTNGLFLAPDQDGDKMRSLTIDGTADVKFVNAFDNLKRFDASHLSGGIREVEIGGQSLNSVLGGSGNDVIILDSIGGTAKNKARISTGVGDDYINLTALGDLSTRQVLVNGGAGTSDTVVLQGDTHSIAGLFKGVETVLIFNLNGSYDLDDRHLLSMQITAPYGNTALNNLRDGFYLNCNDTLNWDGFTLTANVKNAASSDDEMLTLNIYNSIVFGGPSGGFSTPHLSNLIINSAAGDNRAYLGQVGSSGDPTLLTIAGTSHLDLRATTGSNSFVSKLTITNSEGVDLSGLQTANSFFLSSGVTIVGGAGDDILWGGTDADKISTGGGDNTVLGSLGGDEITLAANSGKDTIEYRVRSESTFGVGHDTILNFSAFDTIDVSAIANIAFIGNFADNSSGIAALSTSQARAYFNTATDTLYIDLNHDKVLDSSNDMQVVLTGLDSFALFNLI